MSFSAAGRTRPSPGVSPGEGLRPSEDALLCRVATGDHEAFAAFYDHLGGAAHGLARRVVLDSALADEVTQEAFLNVWLKAATFDPTLGSARTWLLTLTHRRAVDIVRHEESNRDRLRRNATLITDREHDVVIDHVLARESTTIAVRKVTRAWGVLSPLQREAIDLAYSDGFTTAEIAALLNVPQPTIKSRIRDGLIRLAKEMQGADDPTPTPAVTGDPSRQRAAQVSSATPNQTGRGYVRSVGSTAYTCPGPRQRSQTTLADT